MNKQILKGIIFLTLFFNGLFFLFSKIVNSIGIENIRDFVASFGPLSPVVYIFLIVFGIVLPIFPGVSFVGSVLFPFIQGVVYLVIGYQLGAMLTFFISRKFGRGLVQRLVGKKSISRVDEVAEKFGVPFLIMARIFPNFTWDFLGYAAGLTKMNFRVFSIINLLGSIPASTYSVFTLNKIVEDPRFVAISSIIGFAYTLGFALAAAYLYKKK